MAQQGDRTLSESESSSGPEHKMLDEHTKPRGDEFNLGRHELEISNDEEDGFRKRLILCDKDHDRFIGLRDFTKEHLPDGFQDENHVELVKAQSALTCRVKLSRISDQRPGSCTSCGDHFPLSNFKGHSDYKGAGSGWVSQVIRYTEEDSKPCECEVCCGSDHPQKEWGVIEIRTAHHVISDSNEAENTMCHFDYDSAETDLEQCLQLKGLKIVDSNDLSDTCVMRYTTHDMNLITQLESRLQRYDDLYNKLYGVCKNLFLSICLRLLYEAYQQPTLTVITGHPHGLEKQISIGEVNTRTWEEIYLSSLAFYTYTAPTCPGSSGSPVNILGTRNMKDTWCEHPHHSRDKLPGINRSGSATVKRLNWLMPLTVFAVATIMTRSELFNFPSEWTHRLSMLAAISLASALLPPRQQWVFWKFLFWLSLGPPINIWITSLENAVLLDVPLWLQVIWFLRHKYVRLWMVGGLVVLSSFISMTTSEEVQFFLRVGSILVVIFLRLIVYTSGIKVWIFRTLVTLYTALVLTFMVLFVIGDATQTYFPFAFLLLTWPARDTSRNMFGLVVGLALFECAALHTMLKWAMSSGADVGG